MFTRSKAAVVAMAATVVFSMTAVVPVAAQGYGHGSGPMYPSNGHAMNGYPYGSTTMRSGGNGYSHNYGGYSYLYNGNGSKGYGSGMYPRSGRQSYGNNAYRNQGYGSGTYLYSGHQGYGSNGYGSGSHGSGMYLYDGTPNYGYSPNQYGRNGYGMGSYNNGGGDYSAPAQPAPGTAIPVPAPSPMPGQQVANVDLTAHNMAFSTRVMTVQAGTRVVVRFTNQDAVPHNFAVYTDSSAQKVIFRGQTVTGPNASATYQFDAPAQPGTYFFRCDVHPAQMTGQFIVR